MTNRMRIVALSLAALTLTSACAVTINKVLSDPSRYRDRDVRVSGEVMDSYSLASRGVYRLRDGSGQIWVVSDRGVPRTGARVKVTGTIREGFNIGQLASRIPGGLGSGLVLVEKSHSARD